MKKRLLAVLLSLASCCALFSTTTYAVEENLSNGILPDDSAIILNSPVQRIHCATCGHELYFKCAKSRYYYADGTHRYDWNKTCTYIVYSSPYLGAECVVCMNIIGMKEIGVDPDAKHPCVEYHGNCGERWKDAGFCRDGQVW